jgi:heme-degrading monooxygenase HmoA
MVTILWEYQVKAERVAEFEKVYASSGDWAALFQKGRGFLRTKLFHSLEHHQLYTTIDQWESMRDYKMFLSEWKEEYEALDKQCEGLTEHESCLGTFGVGFNDEE